MPLSDEQYRRLLEEYQSNIFQELKRQAIEIEKFKDRHDEKHEAMRREIADLRLEHAKDINKLVTQIAVINGKAMAISAAVGMAVTVGLKFIP